MGICKRKEMKRMRGMEEELIDQVDLILTHGELFVEIYS